LLPWLICSYFLSFRIHYYTCTCNINNYFLLSIHLINTLLQTQVCTWFILFFFIIFLLVIFSYAPLSVSVKSNYFINRLLLVSSREIKFLLHWFSLSNSFYRAMFWTLTEKKCKKRFDNQNDRSLSCVLCCMLTAETKQTANSCWCSASSH
jgi:hypothetical protein